MLEQMTAEPLPDSRDGAHPQRMIILLGMAPALAILIFFSGLALGVEGDDVLNMALALVTGLIASLPLILDQGRPASERRVLISIISTMYLAWFVVPVFTFYIPADGPIDAPGMGYTMLTPHDVAMGQLVVLAALLSMLAGNFAGARWVAGIMPRATRDWPPQLVLSVAFSMIFLGWGIVGLSVVANVGALGSGIIAALASSLIYGNVLFAYAYGRYRSRLAFFALCFTIPFTSLFGFFTGSKEAILVAPAIVTLTGIIYRRRVRARWVVLGVLGLTLIYPTHQFFRDTILVGNTLGAGHALRAPIRNLSRVGSFLALHRPSEYLLMGLQSTGTRLDCLGVTSVIVRDTPGRVPFQNGRTLALFFVAFVPRALWHEKPSMSIGQWVTDVYGSGPEIASSTGPSNVGDYYLNFGVAGVVGGMFLFGLIMGLTQECLLTGRPTASGLMAAVVILYHVALRFEGNVAIQYAATAFALAPVLLTHVALRSMLPSPNRGSLDATGKFAADARVGT